MEREADAIMFLDYVRNYNGTEAAGKEETSVELTISKQRDRPTGSTRI